MDNPFKKIWFPQPPKVGRDTNPVTPVEEGGIDKDKKPLSGVWEMVRSAAESIKRAVSIDALSENAASTKETLEKKSVEVFDGVMNTLATKINECDKKFPPGSNARNIYDKISEKGLVRGIWEGTGEWRLFSLKEKLTPEFEKEHAVQAKAIKVIDAYCSLRTILSLATVGLGAAVGFGSVAVGAGIRGVGGYTLGMDFAEKKRRGQLDTVLASLTKGDIRTEDEDVLNDTLTTIQALAAHLKEDINTERFKQYRDLLNIRADRLGAPGDEKPADKLKDIQKFEKEGERKKLLYTAIDQSIGIGTGAFMALSAPQIFKGLWGGVKGGWHLFSESEVGKKVLDSLEHLYTNARGGSADPSLSPRTVSTPPSAESIVGIHKDFAGATQEYSSMEIGGHEMSDSLKPRPDFYVSPNVPLPSTEDMPQTAPTREWGVLKDQWSRFLDTVIDVTTILNNLPNILRHKYSDS